MNFPCAQCGNCCRNVGKQIKFARLARQNGDDSPIIDEMLAFPHKLNDKGECENLVDNKCSIYETRPDICDVNKLWRKYMKGNISLKLWHELNKRACEANK